MLSSTCYSDDMGEETAALTIGPIIGTVWPMTDAIIVLFCLFIVYETELYKKLLYSVRVK